MYIFAAIMKQLIAIALLLLIGLTIVSGNIKGGSECYEQIADGEDACKDFKEKNKEIKEFTFTKHSKAFIPASSTYKYIARQACILPAPVINRQTPPPDLAC